MKLELRKTNDGSLTLYLPEMDEQYHSLNGAITESKHVFIENGFHFHPSSAPSVFEVGFGTGLNCLLTAWLAEKEKRKVIYTAIEKYPLNTEITEKLDYGQWLPYDGQKLYSAILNAKWGVPVQLSVWFTLLKLKTDFISNNWSLTNGCDVVYFDAFGPDKQPQMWSQELINRIYDQVNPQGVFVTYSAKGEVRRRLISAGFMVEKLPGPPGKKEMLRGIKVGSKISLQKK